MLSPKKKKKAIKQREDQITSNAIMYISTARSTHQDETSIILNRYLTKQRQLFE
jgi:hypothetical protein